MHAPVVSQPVAPHVASATLQAVVQQWPAPLTPQLLDRQDALEVHAVPFASSVAQLPPLQ
jgi:hypothetical protein